MRRQCHLLTAACAAALFATAVSAHPGERDRLNVCKAMVGRATHGEAATAAPDSAQLAKCKKIIWEWAQRDARMSVDENGRPLQ